MNHIVIIILKRVRFSWRKVDDHHDDHCHADHSTKQLLTEQRRRRHGGDGSYSAFPVASALPCSSTLSLKSFGREGILQFTDLASTEGQLLNWLTAPLWACCIAVKFGLKEKGWCSMQLKWLFVLQGNSNGALHYRFNLNNNKAH